MSAFGGRPDIPFKRGDSHFDPKQTFSRLALSDKPVTLEHVGAEVGMKRRTFIGLIGGAATAWSFAIRAQPTPRLPIIGFLGAGSPSGWSRWTAALLQRLQELGWVDGRTVLIEYRWAEGRSERYAEIAAEFVRLKVDVIVSVGSGAIVAKQVTSTIPIVFTLAADPIGDGMVASSGSPRRKCYGPLNPVSRRRRQAP